MNQSSDLNFTCFPGNNDLNSKEGFIQTPPNRYAQVLPALYKVLEACHPRCLLRMDQEVFHQVTPMRLVLKGIHLGLGRGDRRVSFLNKERKQDPLRFLKLGSHLRPFLHAAQ